MIDVTHICICLDYPKLYTNMATGNDVTSHENDLFICAFFLICLFISLSLLILFFQIDRLEPSFTDSVFRIPFPFP